MTNHPAGLPADGTVLRRLGLALGVVWFFVSVVVAVETWTRLGGAGGSGLAPSIVSAALIRTWGWLGAALVVYLTGVLVGLRVHRPRQVQYRPRLLSTSVRERTLPVVIVSIVVVALAIAMIRQTLR